MSGTADHQKLQTALALHQKGKINEAANLYRQLIKRNPDNFHALQFLGIIEATVGNIEQAKLLMARSLSITPPNIQFIENYAAILIKSGDHQSAIQVCQQGFQLNKNSISLLYISATALFMLNKLRESITQFDKLLFLQPTHIVALNERGSALAGVGQYEAALVSIEKALALNKQYAEAHLNKGNVYGKLKRHDEALRAFDEALCLNPALANAWLGRGIIFRETKRYDEALTAYDKALSIKPDLENAWLGRGNVFCDLKRHDEAFAAYDKALSIRSDLAEAWLGRGNVFCDLKRHDEAFAAYDKALSIKPDLENAWLGRGNVFCYLKSHDKALTAYDKALSIKPDLAEAWLGRGNVLIEFNRTDEAIAEFQHALVIKPDYAVARFAACFAELRILYADEQEIVLRREAYAQKLRALYDDVETGSEQGDLVSAIEFKQPFYLAYQGYNDCDLQALYGSLVCHIMEHEYPAVPLPRPPSLDETVRVGVVSAFFHRHPVWNLLIKGWIGQLDRKRFKVFGYHLGTRRDPQTDIAATICDRFVHRDLAVEKWRQEILADAPHVLIYPGQLMDGISIQLAGQRLAPVQCSSWGHPETSGMSTLDYFLSSDLMEPADAEQHYTEKLVRLPNLSIYYEPTDMEAVKMSREELGLRSDATVFWSGQSLFKYLPQFDLVFPRIAKKASNCQFVFIQFQGAAGITELFKERLDRAFAAFGLSAADYCVFLPRLSPEQFVGAIGQCDVVLDSLPWSGGNSTLECLSHNLPIVTMQSGLLRGRHTAAILRMMGITETITETIEDYIATAVRVANDPNERRALSRKVANNKHRLYRDRHCIAALENFIDCVARPHL
jgi:protein O-GlcNAc transferase